jgi:hypothetical protein
MHDGRRRTRRLDSGASFQLANMENPDSPLTTTNNFGYNLRSEVVEALMGTNTYGYAYDPIGNRRAASNNAEILTYLSNELNQYTNIQNAAAVAPAYDPDGNMIFLPSTSGGGAGRKIGVSPNISSFWG